MLKGFDPMVQAATRSARTGEFSTGAFTPHSPTGLFAALYRTPVMERIRLITDGVPAAEAKQWLEVAALGRNATLKALDLPVATFNKKVKANARLSPAESERVLGFARLIGQIEAMLAEAGGPPEFDARAWLARWLTEPLPALGNARPIEFMNTMEGQTLVSQKLTQIASGAYA
jgi:putative toxin-antitoxin system antitoxin component (TIGR02293 family)